MRTARTKLYRGLPDGFLPVRDALDRDPLFIEFVRLEAP